MDRAGLKELGKKFTTYINRRVTGHNWITSNYDFKDTESFKNTKLRFRFRIGPRIGIIRGTHNLQIVL